MGLEWDENVIKMESQSGHRDQNGKNGKSVKWDQNGKNVKSRWDKTGKNVHLNGIKMGRM